MLKCRDVEKIFENKNDKLFRNKKERLTSPWRMRWFALTHEMVRLDGRSKTPWRIESCVKASLETYQGVLPNSSRAF